MLHPFAGPPPDDLYWEHVRQRRGYGLKPPRPACDAPEDYFNRLGDATGLQHCAFATANKDGSFFGAIPFGNAILSRHRLRDVRRLILAVTPGDLTLGAQERTMADLEPRSALAAVVELPGCEVGVCCTHLDHKAEELRERQVGEAIAFCDATFGERAHVISGDLNTFQRADMSPCAWEAVCAHYASAGWPPPPCESLVLRRLAMQGYTDSYASWRRAKADAGDAPPPHPPLTCWSQKPLFRVDYVMLANAPAALDALGDSHASDALTRTKARVLRVCSHRTLTSPISDHLPVVVELELDAALQSLTQWLERRDGVINIAGCNLHSPLRLQAAI